MQRNQTLIRSIVVAIGLLFAFTATAAWAAPASLVGAVVKTDQGTALSTDSGEYLLLGKDLSGMIGKTVSVTGNVEDGALTNTIQVKSVRVLSDKDVIDPTAPKTAPAGSSPKD
jgi:hypothetical protein